MATQSVRVEIVTTCRHDITMGICALFLAPLWLWGAGGGVWHITRTAMLGHGSWLAVPFYDAFGWRGVVVVIAVMAFWMTCNGIGAAWRILDGKPAVMADENGIRFHPSIGPSRVLWSDVNSIQWNHQAHPAEVEIQLKRRFWSLWNWVTSPKVRLNHLAIGLSEADAAHRVTELNVLKGSCVAR